MISLKHAMQRLYHIAAPRCLPRFHQRLSIKRIVALTIGIGLVLFFFTAPYDQYYSSIASVGPRQRRALVPRGGLINTKNLAAPLYPSDSNEILSILPPEGGRHNNNSNVGYGKRVLDFPLFFFGGSAETTAPATTVITPLEENFCSAVPRNSYKADFDTKKLLQLLTKLNVDGGRGVWSEFLEQGYSERLSRDPLPVRVILMPFSHTDPGWLKSIVSYYDDQVGPTLEHMVEQLELKPQMSFIWSEMSFFSMWWSRISHEKKERVRALIQRGQLEIVNGGYVMTDEASSHLYAIVHQYVTGHQFLYDSLNTTVKHGWSIDPFGLSATLPYLYTQLGFHTNYIQRVHYNIKEYLARNRALQFIWQQYWDDEAAGGGLFTYMSPNFLYTIRESCGVHREVCREFDFRTSTGEWYHARNEPISNSNVKQKAQLLASEYERLASLFDHKVYLHLLGDDFRYDKVEEWHQQYNNYELIKNYINNHSDSFNMVVEWGTLDTYYTRIKQSYAKLSELKKSKNGGDTVLYGEETGLLPRLQGDFHPYADRYAEFWSGYYTTRPFVKRLGRELEWRLRNAEILASTAGIAAPHTQSRMLDPEDEWRLKLAGEALGLFQHHDAITGTAKANVMNDYATRLLSGLDSAAVVLTNAARRLLEHSVNGGEILGPDDLTLDFQRPDANSLPQKFLLDIKRNRVERVLVYNSLARTRTAVIKIHCNFVNVEVLTADNQKLDFQINPVWTGVDTISSDAFEVIFFVQLASLSLTPFIIRQLADSSSSSSPVVSSTPSGFFHNSSRETSILPDTRSRMVSLAISNEKLNNHYFQQLPFPTGSALDDDVVLENDLLSLYFSARDGMLHSYAFKNSDITQLRRRRARIALLKYNTVRSGAYIFMPLDAALPLVHQPIIIRIVRGPLISQIDVVYPENVIHKVRLQHVANSIHSAYVDVENIFNIAGMNNNELIMRVSSDIGTGSADASILADELPRRRQPERLQRLKRAEVRPPVIVDSGVSESPRQTDGQNGVPLNDPPSYMIPPAAAVHPQSAISADMFIEPRQPPGLPPAAYTDWYTDANGFQMMPRRTSRNLPIQANYYPITTQAYVEADGRRMTLHVSEGHGAASLQPGELEVMLDRRLNQDDGRGMGEPVVDSRATQQFMRVMFEDVETLGNADSVSNPTLLSQLVNQDLNSPIELLLVNSKASGGSSNNVYSRRSNAPHDSNDSNNHSSKWSNYNVTLLSLPGDALQIARRSNCDLHLLMLRPLPSKSVSSVGLMLHRYGTQCANSSAVARHMQQLMERECKAALDPTNIDVADMLPTILRSAKSSFSVHPSAINFLTPEEAPQMFSTGQIKLTKMQRPTSNKETQQNLRYNKNLQRLVQIEPMNLAAFVLKFKQHQPQRRRQRSKVLV